MRGGCSNDRSARHATEIVMDDDPVFFVVVMKVYRAASELKYSMLAFDAPTIEKTGWLTSA